MNYEELQKLVKKLKPLDPPDFDMSKCAECGDPYYESVMLTLNPILPSGGMISSIRGVEVPLCRWHWNLLTFKP